MPPAAVSTPACVLVSRDPLVRAGLRGVLLAGDWAVAGEVETLAAARSAWLEVPFAAVLWDAGHASALEAVPEAPPVVALVQDETSARAVLEAGAAGAVLRGVTPETVCAALWAVAHGLLVSERAFQERPEPLATRRAPATSLDFTPREQEVLGLLSQGLANRAIAERLGISRHTVKFHVNALLQKLGVQRRTEAVVRAARLGLVVL